jgi:Ran GTPase-activating protein (RanGAP) involved in mRNA processing and transport
VELLGLANTSLDTQAAVTLFSALRDHATLLEVDLSKAILYSRQEDTTKHAAQMVAINSCLQSLNLANMRVGDIGADVLAKALARNRSLKHLCLANNQIGIRGGEAFAELLGSPECCLTR